MPRADAPLSHHAVAREVVTEDRMDPKLVADQLGHGLGVNLDVYTISDLIQRLESVNLLEQSLASLQSTKYTFRNVGKPLMERAGSGPFSSNQVVGSIPIRSLTASRSRCLHPR